MQVGSVAFSPARLVLGTTAVVVGGVDRGIRGGNRPTYLLTAA